MIKVCEHSDGCAICNDEAYDVDCEGCMNEAMGYDRETPFPREEPE